MYGCAVKSFASRQMWQEKKNGDELTFFEALQIHEKCVDLHNRVSDENLRLEENDKARRKEEDAARLQELA